MVLLMWMLRKGLAANQQALNLARQKAVGKVKEATKVKTQMEIEISLRFQLQSLSIVCQLTWK